MRAYYTTTVARTKAIFQEGFTDLYTEFGMQGVYFSSIPLAINDGFDGDTVLCLDVPDDVMEQFDVSDTSMAYQLSLIPAAVLNLLDKPKIYDHTYTKCSRKQLRDSIRMWQQDAALSSQLKAQDLRDAIKFFDSIGWNTPLKLHEEKEHLRAQDQ